MFCIALGLHYLCRQKQASNFMKEEFGKWLMDIAKYVATAVLLTTIFGGMEQKWLICAIASVVILTTGMGLWLVRKKKED